MRPRAAVWTRPAGTGSSTYCTRSDGSVRYAGDDNCGQYGPERPPTRRAHSSGHADVLAGAGALSDTAVSGGSCSDGQAGVNGEKPN